MVVRKLLDMMFSQHDLAWLDDILPDKDKKKEDDKKKKKDKKAAEAESDEEVRETDLDVRTRACTRTATRLYSVSISMCVTPSGLGLSNCFLFSNTVCFSSLSHSVAEKALFNTYDCLPMSVSFSLQVLLFNTSPLLPCSVTMAREDKLTPFYTFVNKFLSNYNQNRTCKELLLGSVNGQMILTKSIKDLK